MFKNTFKKMFNRAMNLNKENILNFLDKDKNSNFLDLGCDDGLWTMKLAGKLETNKIYGVDINSERLNVARKMGIVVKKCDLNTVLPFKDNFFDVVHANQVIEHIAFLDNFISEIFRILKPGGYVVISTENASSWHNIFASIMGWQIFSLTNISSKRLGIGNPLATLSGEVIDLSSWTHKTVFNYRGLKDFFSVYNFKDIKITGAGYYPFPCFIGRIDVKHSHFLTIKACKK